MNIQTIKDLEENSTVELMFSNIKGKEYQVRAYLSKEDYLAWKEYRERTITSQRGNKT